MTQRWLVTGCSTGLGRALAESLAAAGEPVLATARNKSTVDDLLAHGPHVATAALDVRDDAQCKDAVELARQRFGGIDVLVNNAGYGQGGAVEEVSDSELAEQFETNVFGPWRLIRLVLPLWREQGRGHAIFTSSLAGSMPFPGLAAYTASKYALEGLADSLAQDAAHLGVKVTILQLGGFATHYGKSLRDPAQPIPAYAAVLAEMLESARSLANNEFMSQPPLFAKVVRRIAAMEQPPQRVPFGVGAFDYLDAHYTARRAAFDQIVAAGLDQ